MDERSERIARRFEWPMLIAAVLVIPAVILQESDVGEPWKTLGEVLDYGIWVAFVVEIVVMLWVVPDKWLWVRKHPIEIGVVLLTVPFLPVTSEAARALRLLRLVRLMRLPFLARSMFTLRGVQFVAVLAATTLFAGGAAYAALEENRSLWDGVWWATVTMTTVGYGDQFPVTVEGRIVGMALMVIGIGFASLLIGAVAERFVARDLAPAEGLTVTEERILKAAEEVLLGELRSVANRLERIEERLDRLGPKP